RLPRCGEVRRGDRSGSLRSKFVRRCDVGVPASSRRAGAADVRVHLRSRDAGAASAGDAAALRRHRGEPSRDGRIRASERRHALSGPLLLAGEREGDPGRASRLRGRKARSAATRRERLGECRPGERCAEYDSPSMAENSADKPRGPLRALSHWLKRSPSEDREDHRAPEATADPSAPRAEGEKRPLTRIGHSEIRSEIGGGGMGVGWAAHEGRLHREVAIKTISAERQSEEAKARFWREARAAASVNHPNVCQLYEIGEDQDRLFLVMELLQGEALDARMRRGPFPVAETISIGLGILAALEALHERGILHRDLKPSNVFLTRHGVKLLDFGLARAFSADPGAFDRGSTQDLTRTGLVVGTPRSMSPEQVTGEPVDGRSDLFAVGAILFEMLAGRPPFSGRNVVEQLHATLHEQPPALTGSPGVAAIDRVIRRALAKDPLDRPQSAAMMAEELRAVESNGAETPVLARPLTRLIVLPFRILRSDPETDFLAFSLPDAIATSLSSSSSVVVRSSSAAGVAGDPPDLKSLAAQA